MPPSSLLEFLQILRARGEVVDIPVEVDPDLELAEIHRRCFPKGPVLFFQHVKGSAFPVVTNLFGSQERIQLAFGNAAETTIPMLLDIIHGEWPPSLSTLWKAGKILFHMGTKTKAQKRLNQAAKTSLERIPFLRQWPQESGSFLTLPLVFTTSPSSGIPNLGMYRIQRHNHDTAGLHWQLGKGGGHHFFEAEQNNAHLPVTIFLGGAPALILSAIAPLPENVSELLLASLILGKKILTSPLPQHPHPLLDSCDIALCGYAGCHERMTEGPFGDHYGYLDPAHPYPVFHCSQVWHSKDAIVPATIVGKPMQEDAYLGQYLQQLLRPFLSLCVPNLLDIHSFPETGFHPLLAVRITQRHTHEQRTTALRIISEGQLSLSKVVFVVDTPKLNDITTLLPHVLERIGEEDILILPHMAADTLDIAGKKREEGSKAIFFATKTPRRQLPHVVPSLPSCVKHGCLFTPGCLLIDGPSYNELSDPKDLLKIPTLVDWPLIVLVDDAKECTVPSEFLWQTFTRCNPAFDFHTLHAKIQSGTIRYSFPLLIDARTKPWFPKAMTPDEKISQRVSLRWHEYFPFR